MRLFFFFFFGYRCKCNRICFKFFVGGSWQVLGWARLVFVMAVTNFIFFLNLILCNIYIYIYILVIGNIMNKSLFIQVEIAKNLLLLGKITTIIFI